ncbi:TonB-dependent receptor [Limnovirga soli]|uniref:TonB-dependent receptor n=1 Tax=Limnovirga soli TaxID=2656915 RepID=A0A8J8FFJ5_9BACT|nr:TonB-dependent receptor [Limnovirga soli]NNV54189.1 TonB-dependent receptor [Limnovirga soli]
MKQVLSLFTAMGLAAISLNSFAQNVVGSNISGSVFASQKAVESATVMLLKAKDSSFIKSGITSKEGSFLLDQPENGSFLIAVELVGFKKYYSEIFELSQANPGYQVKPISLEMAAQQLSGVIVVSKKPFIEQKLDRTILNVEASVTNVGLTALEVLEKAPGVTVDKDGNVSLKGKQGVLILMDGKPTYLSAADLANFLKNTPSANLDQIEIMTNPPAKYDAAGNSGIINIKTKKTKTKGFNGSVNIGGGMGIHPKANESVNLNYRSGKVNLFGNYSYSYNKGAQQLELTRNFRDQQTGALSSVFTQRTDMSPESQSHNYKMGADYFVSKNTTLGVVVNGALSPSDFNSTNITNITNAANQLQSVTLSKSASNDEWKNYGTNFNMRHVFDTLGTELTGDLDYIHYNSSSNQLFNNYFFNEAGGKVQPDETLRGNLPGAINIYSGKFDFLKTLKGQIKFEAGVKTSFVKTDNNAQYDNLVNGQWVVDEGRSNHFVYKENINAGYTNFSKQLNKKWSAQAGLRVENTNATGNQLTTGETFKREYTQLFPTAYLGYTLSDKNQFALSYGRRIERPDYGDLNPFYYFLDKYTYQVGNPYLSPQFSHNIEISHTYKGFLTTTLAYNNINDIIQQVLEQNDSTFTTFVRQSNIAKQESFTLSVNAGFPVTKWWTTNIYAQANHNAFEGYVNNGNIKVDGYGFTTNISNQFKFNKGWGMELSGFYRSKMVEGTVISKPMGVVNMGISKSVLKSKGTIKLNVRDFLDIQQFNGYSKYQNIDVTIHNEWDNRVVNLSFSYRFSKGKAIQQQRRQSSAEDEQNRIKAGRN